MASRFTKYDLEQITDYTGFESFCHDLMSKQGYKDIEPLGGNKDKGRDAIYVDKSTGEVTIFTYSVREDWQDKLYEDLDKIFKKYKHPCNKVVFVTTSSPTPTEKDNIKEEAKTKYHCRLEIYDLERIATLVDNQYESLRKLHPNIFLLSSMPIGNEEAIKQIRKLSEIAESDAKLVIHDKALGGDICLDQDLYVTRKAEEKVIRNLNIGNNASSINTVVGDAGRGKTSLLWKLYQTLKYESSFEIWFLKSTMLIEKSDQKASTIHGSISPNMIFAAVREAFAEKKRPILLLDTLDLLLHDEASRHFLLELLIGLTEQGCSVVATCRPQEVLRLNTVDYHRVTLLDYEGQELEEAIRKHSARFYAPSIQLDAKDHVAEILEAVVRGLPIREVCINPLTLRMLFTIYAPSQIASDINVFELYKLYWNNRVIKDFRAGSPFPPSNSLSMERPATVVALSMLAEGVPELRTEKLTRINSSLRLSNEEIDILRSRGVLQSSDTGTISFFHQTFFEHSAARGVLNLFASEAISVLKQRIESKPNDLFTSPVYEHALLLAEDDSMLTRKVADEAIINLIDSEQLPAIMSAIYVYCHRRDITHSVKQAMRNKLVKAEESIQRRYLELAPNIPKNRFENLIEELDLIWLASTERVREHVIKLLERLVPRGHIEVTDFIERHELVEYVFKLAPPYNVAHLLLKVIQAVSNYNPKWGWQYLIKLCGLSTSRTRGRELPITILKFIVDKANLFGADLIATRFELDTANNKFDEARDFNELTDIYGDLWCLEWKANNRSVNDILEEISQLPQTMSLVTKMKGLGRFLRSASDESASLAISNLEKENRHYHKAMWAEVVLPSWMQALDSDIINRSDSVKYLQNYVRTKLKEQGIESHPIKSILIEAIREADLSSFAELVNPGDFQSAQPWLDKDHLAYVLVDGFVADHPGAIKAIRLLKEKPEAYWETLDRAVGPRLVRKSLEVPSVMDAFFEIVLKVEDAAFVLRVVEKIPPRPPVHFKNWIVRIADFCKRIMDLSIEPQKRRYAIMIWDRLLTLGLSPAHTIDELVELVNSEADTRARGHLVSIIGNSAARMGYDIKKTVAVLESIAKSADDELRRRGMLALAKVVSEFEKDTSAYADNVLQTAFSPPVTAERLNALKPFIERLTRTNAEFAAGVFKQLIQGAMKANIGTSGKHKLFGKLKPTARAVVRHTTQQARKDLLEMIPKLDRVLGSLIIDAVCHEVLSEFPEELDALLNSNVPGEIKEIIFKYRYTQERSLGGREWPELYRLLTSLAVNP